MSAVFIQWTLRLRSMPFAQRFFFAQLALAMVVENTSGILFIFDHENSVLYNFYIPLEFALLCAFAAFSFRSRLVHAVLLLVVVCYGVVLFLELRQGTPIIFTKSLLLAYATLTITFSVLLVRLAGSTEVRLWKDQRFWVYLSIVVFTGAVIPYVGLMNHLYTSDPALAKSLFGIIEVLFFLRYGMVWLAGALLPRSPVRA
ncbi:MAG: hypothetical protein IPI81_16110 [Flavobacteriales bacterium]|nr:hypothetical protein [Flavobacteriales bacterium]MCC6936849.1 hypothetical protein [Flavobacteriales bacterium]